MRKEKTRKRVAKKINKAKKHLSKFFLVLLIGLVSSIVLSPIAYLRYVNEEYTLFLINVLVIIIIIIICILIMLGKKIKRIKEAKILFSVLLTVGIVIAAQTKNILHVHGLFPTIIMFYYLLPERIASAFCAVSIASVLVVISSRVNTVDLMGVFVTLFLTAMFSCLLFSNYRKVNEQLALLTRIDPLTKSGNRRALDHKISTVLSEQQEQPFSASLLLLDLDHFKKINDNYGHLVGDNILIEFSHIVSKHIRVAESVFRYGGEEFIIGPLRLELAEAAVVAERLRKLIEQQKFINDITLTVSIGVAEYREGEAVETWIRRADTALYTAKTTGRNKAVIESDQNPHQAPSFR